MTLRSARLQVLLFLCLGFVLAQAGAACAAPVRDHAHHAAMTMPCDGDESTPAAGCPMICPLAHMVFPAAAGSEPAPFTPQRVEFSIALSDGKGLNLSPEAPPPRGPGAVELNP